MVYDIKQAHHCVLVHSVIGMQKHLLSMRSYDVYLCDIRHLLLQSLACVIVLEDVLEV